MDYVNAGAVVGMALFALFLASMVTLGTRERRVEMTADRLRAEAELELARHGLTPAQALAAVPNLLRFRAVLGTHVLYVVPDRDRHAWPIHVARIDDPLGGEPLPTDHGATPGPGEPGSEPAEQPTAEGRPC